MLNICHHLLLRRCAAAGVPSPAATVKAGQLHSFPATPAHSMQPAAVPLHFLPVWLDLQLLHWHGQLRLRQPQASVEGLAATLLSQHAANGCRNISDSTATQPPSLPATTIQADTFRKLLSKASDEFGLVEFSRHEEVRSVAEAGGLEQACPACADTPHSLSFDGNFKLTHLRTAGTATTRQPAVQLRMQSDAAVRDFMANPDSAACNAAAGEACNSFAADQALARTVNKFDITGELLVLACRNCSCGAGFHGGEMGPIRAAATAV